MLAISFGDSMRHSTSMVRCVSVLMDRDDTTGTCTTQLKLPGLASVTHRIPQPLFPGADFRGEVVAKVLGLEHASDLDLFTALAER